LWWPDFAVPVTGEMRLPLQPASPAHFLSFVSHVWTATFCSLVAWSWVMQMGFCSGEAEAEGTFQQHM